MTASTIADLLVSLRQASGIEAVSIAARRLVSNEEIMIDADRAYHAASTFKVCVMMETYRQARLGRIGLGDPVVVTNEFLSIADGSTYSLQVEDDSEKALYEVVSQTVPRAELVHRMIAISSNLATNLLMHDLDVEQITAFMRKLGAEDLWVRRGVEDNKAYRLGLNNTASARGLMQILLKLARREVVTPDDSDQMISILGAQQFNQMIPARLPRGVRVAHKSGWTADLHHDAGIVYPPSGDPFVLSIFTKGYDESQDAEAHDLIATLARAVYDHWR